MMAEPDGTTDPFALRDLEWVISSPFLLENPPIPALGDLPETATLLARLKSDPAPLLDHLARSEELNLGRYFETLVIFWLGNLPAVDILGSNLPISDGSRTVGEIDLLFTHDGAVFHWELAVKFYLNIGDGRQEDCFIGPMLKDTLKRKLDHLFGHQLALPDRAAARSALKNLGIGAVTSHPFVKGCLFHPVTGPGTARGGPERISPDSLCGGWLAVNDIERAALPAFDHFLILEKKRWITPYFYREEALKGGAADVAAALRPVFERRSAPRLVALFRDEGGKKLAGAGRYFVTPDGWPALARKTHDCQELGD